MDFLADPQIWLILFVVALIAGWLDTLAGGGGLLCVPALMLTGMPPAAVLATNKLQGSMGTLTASWMMFRHNKVTWKQVRFLMLASFIGSAMGTLIVVNINTQWLSWLIPVVLILVSIYFVFSPNFSEKTATEKISEQNYQRWVIPGIGAYDGLLGPGTGSFFTMAGVALRGQSLLQATSIAKTLNFASNIASLMVFVVAGQVVWVVGFIMMLGQWIGAWLGAHTLFRINPQILRSLIVVMCLLMLAKYVWF